MAIADPGGGLVAVVNETVLPQWCKSHPGVTYINSCHSSQSHSIWRSLLCGMVWPLGALSTMQHAVCSQKQSIHCTLLYFQPAHEVDVAKYVVLRPFLLACR